MHRRIEIDWALSSMTPKAVPAAPLGLRAKQCHADADVEAAAAIADPIMIAMKKPAHDTSRILCTNSSLPRDGALQLPPHGRVDGGLTNS